MTPNTFNSFDDIVSYVRQSATDIDRQRIEEEIDLFVRRGWEPYVLFVVNLLIKMDETYLERNLSAMDSYIIRKLTQLNETLILNKKHSKEVLFNDMLRLDIEVVHLDKAYFIEKLQKFDRIFKEEIKSSGLYYAESLIPQERIGDACERIIISKTPITKEQEKVVLTETKNGTEEENEILRQLLFIKVGYKSRHI